MKNCLIDFNITPYQRRDIKRDDYIIQTTNWDYCPVKAEHYKNDVEEFFKVLFPDPIERNLFLRWISFSLCADLRHKTFTILTDSKGGNNGKSKLIQFLQVFFGFYHMSNPDFFNKPGIVASRDSHNAGLHLMDKKTILLMDDLHEETPLHFGQLKELVGGNITKSGRGIYSKEGFEFKWLASIIMAFNGNVSPSFNGNDKALYDRMIVFPMKAKFVSSRLGQKYNEHISNTNIESNFLNWCSSFLDLLLTKYNPQVYVKSHEFTPDMVSIKEKIIGGTLKYKMWLKNCTFKKTSEPKEYVTLDKLFERYQKFKCFTKQDHKQKFKSYAKNWLRKNGFTVTNINFNVLENKNSNKRRCFQRATVVGLKLEKQSETEDLSDHDINIQE